MNDDVDYTFVDLLINQSAQPTRNMNHYFSTPHGAFNHLYELWQRGEELGQPHITRREEEGNCP